ncbi:group 4 capsule polysaccharide lipoprotein GfcB/YjbF [Aliiruegeria haliotis]|uniref:Group 4 capsule polysaccharide lipoprotein GfcB/YjbF n=1 Tax=Aliiruegeria haliotis TaxID=1280846 RepID=A0A2T0RP87_9RHOB|nr:YjbF family lipoprotein [Aliiruegeria haliotis]PRY23016.1 group 4 capsule polysaccharide lipoprotein GfcB/YjbF [Aliiruegeria haliotis]
MNVCRIIQSRHVRIVAALTFVAVAAGCGNTPDKAKGWETLYEAYQDQQASRKSKGGSAGGEAAQKQAQSIQKAIASSKVPLKLAVLEETQRTAVLIRFAQNGPYTTWRTSSRQTVTTRNGIVTGTRGLGYDLMSSDLGTASSMITGRRSGQANRVYRHLSGENHEVPMLMRCSYSPSGSDTVQLPTGRSYSATKMSERCENDDGLKIRNTYWVTSGGAIPQSIQWISPEVGKVALQTLKE